MSAPVPAARTESNLSGYSDEDRESGADSGRASSRSGRSITFADDLISTKSSKATLTTQQSLGLDMARTESGYSLAPMSSRRTSDTSVKSSGSHQSVRSTGSTASAVKSIRSASTFTNAEGVSVDLAGRGLAGLSVGKTETISATTGETIKPERPSGLLSVHSSKYETMQARQASDVSSTSAAFKPRKSLSSNGSMRSGSRAIGGPVRQLSTSSRTSSGRHSSSQHSSRYSQRSTSMSSRRSGKGFFWDDGESRNSQRLSEMSTARSMDMSFSKRANSFVKSQSSFKDGKEVKNAYFPGGGQVITLQHLNSGGYRQERVGPDEIQLDVYVNDLEFGDVYLEEADSDEVFSKLFYNYELVSEQKRLMMVKWLVDSYDEKQLKDFSEELGELLDLTPKTTSALNQIDAEQAKDVALFIEETDKAVKEKKHKELEEIYEQRLTSVVEALVIKAHQKAEEDMNSTSVRDEKGMHLLDINKEDMHLRFYDTYETTIEIGCGHMSQVLLCNVKEKPTDLFAVKIIGKNKLSKQRLRYLRNEIKLVKTLHHPCLVKTFDVYDHWDYSFIVMEYISGGTLLDFLKRENVFEEQDARRFMFDILRAVAFLHKHHIIHRDLKFDNILCTDSELPFKIKIADFGLARIISQAKEKKVSRVPRTDDKEAYMVVKANEDKEKGVDTTNVDKPEIGDENRNGEALPSEPPSENGAPSTPQTPTATEFESEDEEEEVILTSAVGTPAYAAPELLKGQAYSYGVDVWAAGVILYGMLSGSRPFSGKNPDGVLQSIERGGLEFPKREWSNVSEQARSLVRAMLETNPEYRVTAEEAMRHTWFTQMTYPI